MPTPNSDITKKPKKGLYSGETKNGEAEGVGKEIFANGNSYQGLYKNGKRGGHLHVIFANGHTYAGSFKDDRKHEYGVATYPNGTKYSGQFKVDERHGFGTFTFSDGTVHNGVFENGYLKGETPFDMIDRPISFILFRIIVLVLALHIRTLIKEYRAHQGPEDHDLHDSQLR